MTSHSQAGGGAAGCELQEGAGHEQSRDERGHDADEQCDREALDRASSVGEQNHAGDGSGDVGDSDGMARDRVRVMVRGG